MFIMRLSMIGPTPQYGGYRGKYGVFDILFPLRGGAFDHVGGFELTCGYFLPRAFVQDSCSGVATLFLAI